MRTVSPSTRITELQGALQAIAELARTALQGYHSPGSPQDAGEFASADELTDTGLTYAQLAEALHAQISYE